MTSIYSLALLLIATARIGSLLPRLILLAIFVLVFSVLALLPSTTRSLSFLSLSFLSLISPSQLTLLPASSLISISLPSSPLTLL